MAAIATTGNRSSNRVGANISRKLRAAGFNVSPAARLNKANGMFVSGSGNTALVTLDFGLTAKNLRILDQITDELCTWDGIDSLDCDVLPDGSVLVWIDLRPKA